MLLQLVGSSPLEPSRTELNAQPQAAQHMVRAAAAAANELAGREKKVSEESEVTMAVRCLQAAIEADPRDFRARTLLAALLMKYTRNTIEAEEHLTRAVGSECNRLEGVADGPSQLGAARALDLAEATYAIIFYQCQLYAQTRGFKAAEKKLRDTMAELKGWGGMLASLCWSDRDSLQSWSVRLVLSICPGTRGPEGNDRRRGEAVLEPCPHGVLRGRAKWTFCDPSIITSQCSQDGPASTRL